VKTFRSVKYDGTKKLAVFDAALLLHKPYLLTFWILFPGQQNL